MKHTPGPWKLVEDAIINDDRVPILWAGVGRYLFMEGNPDDVNLILLAPEMLKMLELIDEELGEPASWKDIGADTHRELRALIAAAKGKR